MTMEVGAMPKKKSRAAVSLGRKGGLKRAKNLSAAELSAIGKQGAIARWSKQEEAEKGEQQDQIRKIKTKR